MTANVQRSFEQTGTIAGKAMQVDTDKIAAAEQREKRMHTHVSVSKVLQLRQEKHTHTSGAAQVRVMLRGVGMPLSDQRAKSTSFMLKLLLNHMTLAGRRSPWTISL